MAKFLRIEKKFSPATVAAVLRKTHEAARNGVKQGSSYILSGLDPKAKSEVRNAAGVRSIISWARSLDSRMAKGHTPTSKMYKDPNVRALLPLPVLVKRRGSKAVARLEASGHAYPKPAASNLNLIVTSNGGTTRIEIETDTATAKRMLGAIGYLE